MKYQIDQSGKIEQTEKPTVLAAANGKAYAVILPAKEKRRLQEIFRKSGKPLLFIDAVFAVLLWNLIHEISLKTIEVDTEYPGHTEIIQKMLQKLSTLETSLKWVRVGKASKVHDIAYKIYKGKLKIGKIVHARNIEALAIKIAGGRLNTGLSPASRRSGPASKIIVAKRHKKSRV